MNYDWIKPRQHIITIRDRDSGWARQKKVWNHEVIQQVLDEQKDSEDVFITKYPKNRLVETVILDFDDKDNPKNAYDDCVKLHNYLNNNQINSVIVESGSKGNHLYIQIAPFKFKDTELRNGIDWSSFFNAFVCFLINDRKEGYETLDKVNFTAGLNGNIRLIGSKHPTTGNTCRIIKGSFKDINNIPKLQDKAQKFAYHRKKIIEQDEAQKQLKKTKVVGDNDPIKANDLRDVFRDITGDMKLYPKGYGYCSCPVHGKDEHYSLLTTKEWFSCSACSFKGNIWTLRKMGLVEFDNNGVVK